MEHEEERGLVAVVVVAAAIAAGAAAAEEKTAEQARIFLVGVLHAAGMDASASERERERQRPSRTRIFKPAALRGGAGVWRGESGDKLFVEREQKAGRACIAGTLDAGGDGFRRAFSLSLSLLAKCLPSLLLAAAPPPRCSRSRAHADTFAAPEPLLKRPLQPRRPTRPMLAARHPPASECTPRRRRRRLTGQGFRRREVRLLLP